MDEEQTNYDNIPLLQENVPVIMPELPPTILINTTQRYKAMGDPTRSLITSILKHQPMTTKQIGAQLHIPPSTVAYHIQVLESASLIQVVARRLIRGIVAKYYTRTAKLFIFDHLQDSDEIDHSVPLSMMTELQKELTTTITTNKRVNILASGFPHTQISHERAEEFADRLYGLLNEFAIESPDPQGLVFGLGAILFVAPDYLQPQKPSLEEKE
jgi:DNA-binding transcriptional ArsR family regulator